MQTVADITTELRAWLKRPVFLPVRQMGVRSLGMWPFIGLVVLLAWLMGLSLGAIPEHLYEGEIAPYDIRADRQYVLIDEAATAKRRADALAQTRSVYDYDTEAGAQLPQRVREAFVDIRAKWAVQQFEAGREPAAETLAGWRTEFERALGLRLSDAQWEALRGLRFGEDLETQVVTSLVDVAAVPLVSNVAPLQQERELGIVLRKIAARNGQQTVTEEIWQGIQLDQVMAVDVARERIALPRHGRVIRELVTALIQPNCAPNLLETDVRRSRVAQDVTPVAETVKAGEMIVRRGEPYTVRQVWVMREIQRQKTSGAWPLQSAGYALFVAVLLLLLHTFGVRHVRKYRHTRNDLFFLGSVLVVMVLVLRAGAFLSEALAAGLPLPIPRLSYYYFIPVAAGGMIIRFLLNSETALLFLVALAGLAGILFPHDPSFTAYTFAVNLAGATAIAYADKRSSIIRAGLLTGLVAACVVAAIHFMRAGAVGEVLSAGTLAWHMSMAMGGAAFAAILLLALTPVAESLFGYTSDIKLLELANLNHPLLRELVIRAPGTYHHSHLVGILAEAAAGAIGSNPLLARVGAYYHDIGKIKKPMYFTENVKGVSPHERLNPHMSALIIASHVKEGMELARNAHLPQTIIDMIPQHHGTKMIGYFFERARELATPGMGEIDEKDFRYPGPKPQSREAGLLLLADGVEGAVRALKEKSPTRIQQTVDSIINKSFAEGQLDECELTLKDLHATSRAFTRILLGIYHQRIEYPREALALRNRDVQVVEAGDDTEHPDTTRTDPTPISGAS